MPTTVPRYLSGCFAIKRRSPLGCNPGTKVCLLSSTTRAAYTPAMKRLVKIMAPTIAFSNYHLCTKDSEANNLAGFKLWTLKLCSRFRGEHLVDIVVSSLTFLYIRDVRLCTGFILYLNVIDKAYYFNFGYKHELPLQLCCTGQAISISYPCSVAWLPAFADTLAPGHPGFSAAPCLPVFRLRAMQVLKRKFE